MSAERTHAPARKRTGAQSTKKRRATPSLGRFIWVVTIKAIGLALRLLPVFLAVKRKAKRAAKTYKKELLDSGMDKEYAELLVKDYLSSTRMLRQFIARGRTASGGS